MRRAEAFVAAAVLLVAGWDALPQAHGQPAAAPDAETQRIIDALAPRPAEAPATRSSRNLIVRELPSSDAGAASAPTAAAAPPSLSMAIQFDFDSARLRPQGVAELMRLAAALRSPQLAGSRFLVEGHTDAQGAPGYNLRLSQSRADEVRRFLQLHGVAGERITTVGRGAQQPANPADPLAAENRRVHIVNLGTAAAR
ncbi:OmpA family protein [Rhizobacter sp. J219]|uniref:OmpA family protein n=1 Tax=Rhizobacter sp. J219 TaxID=2898430 RepID=UPI0021515571|nr:OmpA family protein [Rhizobacter sp. J219]MCR5885539.1 OmpA family protein [Rhizobacter sp. J219]